MKKPRIRDILSIQKPLKDIKRMRRLRAIIRFFRPLIRLIGIDSESIKRFDSVFASIDGLEHKMIETAASLDRFNELFSSRGWTAYESMNHEVTVAATKKAENGAEADLVDYYDLDTVKWMLQTMMGVGAFRSRMALAQKAFDDYAEGESVRHFV